MNRESRRGKTFVACTLAVQAAIPHKLEIAFPPDQSRTAVQELVI